MPKTYYDSELTAAEIESVLQAIHDVVSPSNNGKILGIESGRFVAKSASEYSGDAVLESLNVTANGDYYPRSGTDGFDEVHVAVPGATLTTKSITANGTYNASSDNADGYSSVTVDVQGGGIAVVQPLSVTQNGTYNPPSGVDGYAPVTVNVSGGGEKQIEATAAVQNDIVVVDGCSIVSQPAIVDGKMSATSALGLQITPIYIHNVCLEVDYQYLSGPAGIVFSLGGSNTQSGVLVLTNTTFEFYATGSRIKRTDLSINFDQERHVKFIATTNGELYVVLDDVLILSGSSNFTRNIVNYCAMQSNIAVGWNQSAHAEYNNGTFNNVKISFNVDLPNT